MQEGMQLTLCASLIAGLVTTTVTAPPDYVKSITMHSKAGINTLQVVRNAFSRDGGRSFFRGWGAAFVRLGPHTMITITTLEWIRRLVDLQAL